MAEKQHTRALKIIALYRPDKYSWCMTPVSILNYIKLVR